jgi:tetratricopeptide (TPR) repeat protein
MCSARARREIARRKPPENLQAYEYYTLGMEHRHQFTDQDNKKARVLFQRALQLDPNFARAYVGLAWTHNLDIDFGWTESREQSLEDWVAAARRAIASDPYDSEARTAPGTYYQYLNDFPRAGAEIGQSLELNPNHANRLAQAAWYWTRGGQPERSLELMERAVRLNPHHPDWYGTALRETYFHNRRFEEAIAVTRKRLYPDPIWDPLYRAMSYAQLRHDDEAAVEAKQVFVDQPDYSAEKWLNDTGTYAREVDLELFLDSNEKAGLPLCATEAQLVKYPDILRMPQCEAERVKS